MLSMMGVESYLVASTCLTTLFKRSFFFMGVHSTADGNNGWSLGAPAEVIDLPSF
jgi:hypothetical protein